MSFGFGIGDIIAVSDKAWKLYQLCSCDDVLNALEQLLDKYEAFSTKEQSVWNQFKLGLEDITKLQQKLDTNIGLLTAYNASLANSSLSRVEKALKKIARENRDLGDGSMFSRETTESTVQSREVWDRITGQLRNAGVSQQTLTEHADYITAWIIQTDSPCISQSVGNGSKENTDPIPENHVGTSSLLNPRIQNEMIVKSGRIPTAQEEFALGSAIALRDFKASRDGELGFNKGDVIVVLERDNIFMNHRKEEEEIWWKGSFQGSRGIFPEDFVLVYPCRILSEPTFRSDGMSSVEKVGRVYSDLRSLERTISSKVDALRLYAGQPSHLFALQTLLVIVNMVLGNTNAFLDLLQWHYDAEGEIWIAVEASLIAAMQHLLNCLHIIVVYQLPSIAPPRKFRRLDKSLDRSEIQELVNELVGLIRRFSSMLRCGISANPQIEECIKGRSLIVHERYSPLKTLADLSR
ncbi:hypothetical protein MMC17_009563 [Xylographa soralifera]|nr:hypothetical protein [Xylographa soralifera]